MKVLVTGGAGQVGSAVADLLLARSDAVWSIDNFATGRRANLAAHPRLTKIGGSIVDKGLVERLFGEFLPDFVGAHRCLL
jgi:UDP-glucose 4-epimerase